MNNNGSVGGDVDVLIGAGYCKIHQSHYIDIVTFTFDYSVTRQCYTVS